MNLRKDHYLLSFNTNKPEQKVVVRCAVLPVKRQAATVSTAAVYPPSAPNIEVKEVQASMGNRRVDYWE